VNTPATQAATYSPTEWPITAAGAMPQARQSCVRAYSTAKSAGCVQAVSWMAAPSAGPARSTDLSVRPWASAPSRLSQRSMMSRYSGEAAYSASLMPGYCEPWPV